MPTQSTYPEANQETTILVVDDEPLYCQLIEFNLAIRNYTVVTADTGAGALVQAARFIPDLILLDVMLPDVNGFEVCRRLRAFTDAPIIMLTARADERYRVQGLDAGADDYVTKPFGVDELLARVRAHLRRIEIDRRAQSVPALTIGELTIDRARRRVFLRTEEIELTQTEYRLLDELARNAGYVVTIDALAETIWGAQPDSSERAIRQTIYRLRQKLEAGGQPKRYIYTRSGVGYLLADPERPPAEND
jgi:DNA-binding response OmpR family regulator